MANLLLRRGDLREATVYYEQAVGMKPESVEARDKLGLMYAQQGRLEDAIVQFREAIRIKPSDPIARQSLAKVEAQR